MGRQFDINRAAKALKILKQMNKDKDVTIHMLKKQNEWLSTPTLNNGILSKIGLWFTIKSRGLTNVKSSKNTNGRTSTNN